MRISFLLGFDVVLGTSFIGLTTESQPAMLTAKMSQPGDLVLVVDANSTLREGLAENEAVNRQSVLRRILGKE